MVKLNKIYTRTGDGGSAGLVDGSRASKSSLRMTAIGEVDEANAAIGVAIAALTGADPSKQLLMIQNDLFDLGADVATPGEIDGALRIVVNQVERLEREIDAMNAGLPPLTSFILPSGTAAVSTLHLARAVVRRAERASVALNESEPLNPLRSFVRRRPLRRGARRRRRAVAAGSDAHLSGTKTQCSRCASVSISQRKAGSWRSPQLPSTVPSSTAAPNRRRPTR